MSNRRITLKPWHVILIAGLLLILFIKFNPIFSLLMLIIAIVAVYFFIKNA